MKNCGVLRVAPIVLAVIAAGCSVPGGMPTAGTQSPAARAQAASAPSSDASRHKQFAGKYTGTIGYIEDGVTYSGTMDTILRFNNKNIRGPFKFTVDGQTHNFRIYGRIRSKAPGELSIAFLVYNKAGNYATGNATITNGTFSGRAKLVTQPDVTLKINATKS